MLPSEFPEVKAHSDLKRLLAEHVDMQFEDMRTMLQLPAAGLPGGCNFAAAAVLFNIISGCSVCFYNASEKALTEQGQAGKRFKGLLERFYPWAGEALGKEAGSALLYKAARNPLAHRLGLDAPPSGAAKGSETGLKKWPLSVEQVVALEDSSTKPSWALATIAETTEPSGAKRSTISVPALYWGVHRMLHKLFGDAGQVGAADALAKMFGPLWDKYIDVGDTVTATDAVKVEISGPSSPAKPA